MCIETESLMQIGIWLCMFIRMDWIKIGLAYQSAKKLETVW